MKLLDRLAKRSRFLDIPNAALFVVLGQVLTYGLILAGRASIESLLFIPAAVFEGGEFWRLITCMICPPQVPTSPLSVVFLAFYWYIFWFTSSALVGEWGNVRYNLYLLAAVVFNIALASLGHLVSPAPAVFASPEFFYSSVFLAFATRNPNIEFLIFFVLPVKVKWLGWLMGGFIALAFIGAPTMGYRLAVLGSVANYLLFFGGDFVRMFRSRQRRASFETEARKAVSDPFHTCERCGATDRSHPEREFRYKTVEGEPVCLCEACRES